MKCDILDKYRCIRVNKIAVYVHLQIYMYKMARAIYSHLRRSFLLKLLFVRSLCNAMCNALKL